METLIVAQYSADLTDLLDEVSMSASALGATLLVGEVTERTIADRTRGKSFDLVIFTGHGTESGYVLSDGELSPDGLGTYLRRWKTGGVILNCCCSWRWVPAIQRNEQIEVVAANTDDLDDRIAWRAMEDILHGLRDGLSLQASADSSASHSFWGVRGVKMEGRAAVTEYNQYIHTLEQSMGDLKLELAKKDAADTARFERIEAELKDIKAKIDYQRGKSIPDWKINLLIITMIIGFALIAFVIYGMGNGWWAR